MEQSFEREQKVNMIEVPKSKEYSGTNSPLIFPSQDGSPLTNNSLVWTFIHPQPWKMWF